MFIATTTIIFIIIILMPITTILMIIIIVLIIKVVCRPPGPGHGTVEDYDPVLSGWEITVSVQDKEGLKKEKDMRISMIIMGRVILKYKIA